MLQARKKRPLSVAQQLFSEIIFNAKVKRANVKMKRWKCLQQNCLTFLCDSVLTPTRMIGCDCTLSPFPLSHSGSFTDSKQLHKAQERVWMESSPAGGLRILRTKAPEACPKKQLKCWFVGPRRQRSKLTVLTVSSEWELLSWPSTTLWLQVSCVWNSGLTTEMWISGSFRVNRKSTINESFNIMQNLTLLVVWDNLPS